jgi:hypothetical protein
MVIDYSRDYCANETDIIDHILYRTSANYNRHKTPTDPVSVRIELWIQEVTSVSEMTQDFEIGECNLYILVNCFRQFAVLLILFAIFY